MPALQIIFWLFLEVILISHLHFLLSFKTSFFSERSTKALQKSPWVVSFQNSLLDHHGSSISEVKFAILPPSPWDIRRKIITFSSSMINRDVEKCLLQMLYTCPSSHTQLFNLRLNCKVSFVSFQWSLKLVQNFKAFKSPKIILQRSFLFLFETRGQKLSFKSNLASHTLFENN